MTEHMKQRHLFTPPTNTPRIWSVSFRDNPECPQGVREDLAKNMVAEVAVGNEEVRNDFDGIAIFDRPIFNATWNEGTKSWENLVAKGEEGFTLSPTEANREVVFRCTPFWYYAEFDGESTPCFVSVSDRPIEGYRLAPMFKDSKTPVYRPCFELAIGADGRPHSRAGLTPYTGTPHSVMAKAREYGTRAHTESLEEWFSDYLLLLVEFGTRHLQSVFAGHYGTSLPLFPYYPTGDEGGLNVTDRFYSDIAVNEGGVYELTGEDSYTGTPFKREVTVLNVEFYEKKNIYLFSLDIGDYYTLNTDCGNLQLNFVPLKTGTVMQAVGNASSGVAGPYATSHCGFIWRGKENAWGNVSSLIYNIICTIHFDGTLRAHYLEDVKNFDGTLNQNYTACAALGDVMPGIPSFIKSFGAIGEIGMFPNVITSDAFGFYWDAYMFVHDALPEDECFMCTGALLPLPESLNHGAIEILPYYQNGCGGRLVLNEEVG